MLKAGDAIGTAEITIKGVSGSNTSDYNVQLPIVSANPFFTEVQDTMVQPNNAIILIPKKFGLEGTNKSKIACHECLIFSSTSATLICCVILTVV